MSRYISLLSKFTQLDSDTHRLVCVRTHFFLGGETFRNPLVSFSSRFSSESSDVPSNVASSHQHHGRSQGHDDTCHSGWNGDSLCTTRLRDTTWHSLCVGHHYLDLELKTVDLYEWRESHQQFLKH